MKEITGNIFNKEVGATLVITTNGIVKANGEAVMGAGIALEAKNRWPDLPIQLGDCITRLGNRVFRFEYLKNTLITFPVKHHFREKADLELIEKSCKELVELAKMYTFPRQSIYLPRPGCGAGKLKWSVVKPLLKKYLDNRFVVIDLEGGENG